MTNEQVPPPVHIGNETYVALFINDTGTLSVVRYYRSIDNPLMVFHPEDDDEAIEIYHEYRELRSESAA